LGAQSPDILASCTPWKGGVEHIFCHDLTAIDSPLLEQCNCMQGSHWTSSTSVNVEWTCCCLSVFVGFTPLADAAAMASSPPSAGNSFGASADRWDGVKAFSGIAGFYQKNQELQRLLRNKFQEQT